MSGKKIEEGLKQIDVDGSDIDAIFVTHEHLDHVDGIGVLSRRYDIPIYATEGTWDNMPSKVGKIKPLMKNAVYEDEDCIFNDMLIRPFAIPHDAAQPVGYTITSNDKKITVATDMGHITENVVNNIMGSNILLLESNHDVDMLKNGSYTYSLKQRILSDVGHLSNYNAGKLLSRVIKDVNSKLEYVFLGHLSNDNNHPQLAYDTVRTVLEENEIYVDKDVNMWVAMRYGVKRVIEI
jgi:phosphoribosyl 1,2-cyclic phosphodiesterase